MIATLALPRVIVLLCIALISSVYAKEQTSSLLPLTPTHTQAASPIYTIRITHPEDQEIFQNGVQNIPVSLEITPPLEAEDKIQVYIDNIAAGEAQHRLNFNLPWLPRGSHTIQAKVLQQNDPAAESSIITIYQQRTSVILTPSRAK